jgi:hypothetical protein
MLPGNIIEKPEGRPRLHEFLTTKARSNEGFDHKGIAKKQLGHSGRFFWRLAALLARHRYQ